MWNGENGITISVICVCLIIEINSFTMFPDNENQQEAGDRAEANRLKNIPDGDSNPGEAQNVIDGAERISGEEAEKARSKAMEGINKEEGS
jgi:hypothetical protein